MTDHESTITERVRRIAANHQGVAEDEIADDRPLFQNLDSLDIEELIMAFEDEFGCRIHPGRRRREPSHRRRRDPVS